MKKIKGVALILALVATTGCQGFPIRSAVQDRSTTESPDMSSYFVQRLEDGRRHLSAQRPAAAVTAFRQASYHPDYAGEAYNGMAIAYDRMGRYDLAERFFVQAVEANPLDDRFARNAARFEATILARQEAASAVELAAADVAEHGQDAPEQVVQAVQFPKVEPASGDEGRLQRVSTREVMIASREDWTTRIASAESERPAVLHIGSRQGLGEARADVVPEYPVRIDLAAVPVVAGDIVDGEWRALSGSRFSDARGAARVSVSGTVRRHVRPEYPITIRLDPPG